MMDHFQYHAQGMRTENDSHCMGLVSPNSLIFSLSSGAWPAHNVAGGYYHYVLSI